MSHTEAKQDQVHDTNEPLVENIEKVEEEHVIQDTPLSDSTQSPVQTNTTTTNTTLETQNMSANVLILKEAFPDTDVDVIEAVLQAQSDNVESSFELLLGISDPNYNATPVEVTPAMPPRPQQQQQRNESDGTGGAPYAYWENQVQPEPKSVEEQMRMDEELAKKLALEDQRRTEQRKMQMKDIDMFLY